MDVNHSAAARTVLENSSTSPAPLPPTLRPNTTPGRNTGLQCGREDLFGAKRRSPPFPRYFRVAVTTASVVGGMSWAARRSSSHDDELQSTAKVRICRDCDARSIAIEAEDAIGHVEVVTTLGKDGRGRLR